MMGAQDERKEGWAQEWAKKGEEKEEARNCYFFESFIKNCEITFI
jgi:hypothetical protein